MIALAMVHIVFPRRFGWKEECRRLSLLNRQIMYVHTFFIAMVVFLMGVLCVSHSYELIDNAFGRRIALGLFFFWLARLFVQAFVYSPQLWRGKRFETTVHIVFSLLWAYFSIVFLIAFLYSTS